MGTGSATRPNVVEGNDMSEPVITKMEGPCACGRFAAYPEDIPPMTDGVYHMEPAVGNPICELLALKRERDAALIRAHVATQEMEQLRALLGEVEWVGHTMPGGPVEVWLECPVCESVKTDGHTDGCRLALALSPRPDDGEREGGK